jgi:hypothetical protein
MLGTEHSVDLMERVHHLSRLAFTAEEILHLLALPLAMIYRALQQVLLVFTDYPVVIFILCDMPSIEWIFIRTSGQSGPIRAQLR